MNLLRADVKLNEDEARRLKQYNQRAKTALTSVSVLICFISMYTRSLRSQYHRLMHDEYYNCFRQNRFIITISNISLFKIKK